MKIYTSYFANWRNWPQAALPISITRFPPKGYKELEYQLLAPSEELLIRFKNKDIDELQFRIRMLKYLNSLNNITGNYQGIANNILYIRFVFMLK